MGIKILRPPKVNVNVKGGLWKQIGMIIIGTTISLAFTIVAASLVERHHRDKDRHLMAMALVSAVDIYGQMVGYVYDYVGRSDTVSQWLLSHPVEDLEQLPEEELAALVDDALQLYSLSYDNTTYKIFSASIDTWKNLRNFQFVDNVGMCYSLMQSTIERWNHWGDEIEDIKHQIITHPDDYPGINLPSKYLRNKELRIIMGNLHNYRDWLRYRAQSLQYYNRVNMVIMDITQEELDEFVQKIHQNVDVGMELPGMDYETPAPSPDSLTSLAPLDARLDIILQHK